MSFLVSHQESYDFIIDLYRITCMYVVKNTWREVLSLMHGCAGGANPGFDYAEPS